MSNDTVPPWPSLYNPSVEVLHIQHQPAVQPGGKYLYQADDVFRFTLYWTIIFYIPPFLICGFYAFWNYAFPPSPRALGPTANDVQMSALDTVSPESKSNTHARLARRNERRSRVTFAIIVLLTFISLALAGAVIGSAILGFAAFGLYKSGNFNMSTWVPFLLAIMNVLTGLLRQNHTRLSEVSELILFFHSVWPSIIEII